MASGGRVVSWNVNGLRAVLKRRNFCDVTALLTALECEGLSSKTGAIPLEVACFQETKLIPSELTESMAIPNGFHGYFSICKPTRRSVGYSGVVTYTRKPPIQVEEGVTGVLNDVEGEGLIGGLATERAFCDWTTSEKLEVDSEGRCVVTDHGGFVLFNCYVPAISVGSDENKEKHDQRVRFKKRFLSALERRIKALHYIGRCVILVGDLNISHESIDVAWDCVDPNSSSRKWLRRMLHMKNKAENEAKQFAASTRTQTTHTETEINVTNNETVSETANSAQSVSVSVSVSVSSSVSGSVSGSESASREVGGGLVDSFRYFHPKLRKYTCWSQVTSARKTNYGTRIDQILVSKPLMKRSGKDAGVWDTVLGSDHCPVYALFSSELFLLNSTSGRKPIECRYSGRFSGQKRISSFFQPPPPPEKKKKLKPHPLPMSVGRQEVNNWVCPRCTLANIVKSIKCEVCTYPRPVKRKSSRSLEQQASIRRFFQSGPKVPMKNAQKDTETPRNPKSPPQSPESHPQDPENPQNRKPDQRPDRNPNNANSLSRDSGRNLGINADRDRSDRKPGKLKEGQSAKQAWRKMLSGKGPPAPKCKVHGLECVIRTVLKKGTNWGRKFYVCSLPDGNPGTPGARCEFFCWATRTGKPLLET
ncbi:hypothetical protein AAMO2058_000589400 [Amorphochlora amoebiformis]